MPATPIDQPNDVPGSSTQAASSGQPMDLVHGIEPDYRYRCDACANVTRFDVVMTATTRRYHHFDLGGVGRIDEEEVLDREIQSVTCRWCGRTDAISVESAPVAPTEG